MRARRPTRRPSAARVGIPGLVATINSTVSAPFGPKPPGCGSSVRLEASRRPSRARRARPPPARQARSAAVTAPGRELVRELRALALRLRQRALELGDTLLGVREPLDLGAAVLGVSQHRLDACRRAFASAGRSPPAAPRAPAGAPDRPRSPSRYDRTIAADVGEFERRGPQALGERVELGVDARDAGEPRLGRRRARPAPRPHPRRAVIAARAPAGRRAQAFGVAQTRRDRPPAPPPRPARAPSPRSPRARSASDRDRARASPRARAARPARPPVADTAAWASR